MVFCCFQEGKYEAVSDLSHQSQTYKIKRYIKEWDDSLLFYKILEIVAKFRF